MSGELDFEQGTGTKPTETKVDPAKATEVQDPVAPVTEPKVEAPVVDTPAPVLAPAHEPHPLDPGGVRFKQVVARSHKERERADALEIELQTIRAELDALKPTVAANQPKTPSWLELEAAIAEGRITRAQASEFREQEVLKKAELAVQARMEQQNRRQMVNYELSRYLTAAPDLNDRASELRQRVDNEFDFIIGTHGRDSRVLTADERRTFELQAVRAVLGPVEAVRVPSRPATQAHMEMSGTQTKPTPKVNPDQALLDALKPEQVTHYRKMIAAGQYSGWKDVVDELKWTPPVRK
jgi:hypothetical protein